MVAVGVVVVVEVGVVVGVGVEVVVGVEVGVGVEVEVRGLDVPPTLHVFSFRASLVFSFLFTS